MTLHQLYYLGRQGCCRYGVRFLHHDRAHLATVDIYTLVQRTPKISIGIDATEQAVFIDDADHAQAFG